MFFNQAGTTDLFQKDYTLVTTAVFTLQEYLLSETLYWMVPFQGRQISLTPGQLLLASKRLPLEALKPEDKEKSQKAINSWTSIRRQWLSAWHSKAEKEWNERIHRLSAALAESETLLSPVSLKQMAGERALIELLSQDLKDKLSAGEVSLVRALDDLFRVKSRAGEFIWAEGLKAEFTEADFWFLYRQSASGKK
ncbi:MAG: hypothetical protein LWX83_11995 [Anaerolineae bacterium]|nr:hypothetical protein [Anaerolineae bacterium]